MARDTNWQDRVASACDGLLPTGARIVVAVSGGADSLALLHVLHALAPRRHWTLALAHYNHRQDPAIDDAAAAALRDLAGRLAVPYLYAQADLAPEASEAVLREARYAFLGRVCRDWQAGYLAVAHHADDQAETVLLRLLRGAVAGLGGMRACRPLDEGHPPVQVVRPLLDVRKTALTAYAAEAGLPVFADPSNANPRFRRNWLRAEVLPRLEARWPNLVSVLNRNARWLAEDDAYLQAEAARVLAGLPDPPAPLTVAALTGLPGPIRRRVLRLAMAARTGRAPDGNALTALEAVVAGERPKTNLHGDWWACRQGGLLTCERADDSGDLPEIPAAWREMTDVPLAGWPYALSLRRGGGRPADPWTAVVPDELMAAGLSWRGLRAGDRIPTPEGRLRAGEWLRSQGVSANARRRLLVLAKGAEVLWLAGHRRSSVLSEAADGWIVTVRDLPPALSGGPRASSKGTPGET